MNMAMLAKLGWQFLTRPDLLWVQLLRNKYGDLFQECTKQNISTTWRHIRSTIPLLRACLESSNVQSSGINDVIQWRGTSSGKFTLVSAYDAQFTYVNPSVNGVWDYIWATKGPGHLNFVLWQAYRGLLLTGAFLHQRHIWSSSICDTCGHMMEDILHALQDCPWVYRLWCLLVQLVDGSFFSTTAQARIGSYLICEMYAIIRPQL